MQFGNGGRLCEGNVSLNGFNTSMIVAGKVSMDLENHQMACWVLVSMVTLLQWEVVSTDFEVSLMQGG